MPVPLVGTEIYTVSRSNCTAFVLITHASLSAGHKDKLPFAVYVPVRAIPWREEH
jgi:hypothetical protein